MSSGTRSRRNNDNVEGVEPVDVSHFQEQLTVLQTTVQQQADLIRILQRQLKNEGSNTGSQLNVIGSAFKSPPVPIFKGNVADRKSERVKSFFYSIKKYGTLCNYSEAKMVALAECHLQDRAASWMLGLERENQKPETLEELRQEMIREFVPTNERAAARVRLMDIKLKDSKDLN